MATMITCGTCGSPATHCASDFRQREISSDGEKWCVWEAEGEWRFGCDEHPVEGKLYLLDGSVKTIEKGEDDASALS